MDLRLNNNKNTKKVTETSIKIISNEKGSRDGGAKSTQTRIPASSSITIQGASLQFFIEVVLLEKELGCSAYSYITIITLDILTNMSELNRMNELQCSQTEPIRDRRIGHPKFVSSVNSCPCYWSTNLVFLRLPIC